MACLPWGPHPLQMHGFDSKSFSCKLACARAGQQASRLGSPNQDLRNEVMRLRKANEELQEQLRGSRHTQAGPRYVSSWCIADAEGWALNA